MTLVHQTRGSSYAVGSPKWGMSEWQFCDCQGLCCMVVLYLLSWRPCFVCAAFLGVSGGDSGEDIPATLVSLASDQDGWKWFPPFWHLKLSFGDTFLGCDELLKGETAFLKLCLERWCLSNCRYLLQILSSSSDNQQRLKYNIYSFLCVKFVAPVKLWGQIRYQKRFGFWVYSIWYCVATLLARIGKTPLAFLTCLRLKDSEEGWGFLLPAKPFGQI